MTTDTLNLVTLSIAILSLVVSCTMAGWTIYRDAIQLPKFRMHLGIYRIIEDQRVGEQFIQITALNLGPRSNRTGNLIGRHPKWRRWILRDKGGWFLNYDLENRLSTQPNTKIEVGDKATFIVPFSRDCFLKRSEIYQVGLVDGYGRSHWVPRSELLAARKEHREKFAD